MAERVSFPSTTGPILAGLLDVPGGDVPGGDVPGGDVPGGEIRGWGVFAHGFTLGKGLSRGEPDL